MKKILLTLIIAGLSLMGYTQVSDNAVIPVSVTLSGILRLNVTSGGNIEFAVNTLNQYTNGIANSDAHDTHFTVASSTDFNVTIMAEDSYLVGSDNALSSGGATPSGNYMNLDNIEYELAVGTGGGTEGTNWNIPTISGGSAVVLTDAAVTMIDGINNAAAGDITQNTFIINWSLAQLATSGTLLSQDLASDRYSTNVFISLVAE